MPTLPPVARPCESESADPRYVLGCSRLAEGDRAPATVGQDTCGSVSLVGILKTRWRDTLSTQPRTFSSRKDELSVESARRTSSILPGQCKRALAPASTISAIDRGEAPRVATTRGRDGHCLLHWRSARISSCVARVHGTITAANSPPEPAETSAERSRTVESRTIG
jgi:hypothetical protein